MHNLKPRTAFGRVPANSGLLGPGGLTVTFDVFGRDLAFKQGWTFPFLPDAAFSSSLI
jgi:hypothetical protein